MKRKCHCFTLLAVFLITISNNVQSKSLAIKFDVLESYPFGYTSESGKRVGTYWEYVEALGFHLDQKIERKIVPKTRVLEHLKLGLTDAAILFRTKSISPYVEFVSKIREVPIIIVSKNHMKIEHYAQLQELKSVGHFRSGSISRRFDNDSNINKVAIYTYPKMIEMLINDRVEAVVGNGIVIRSLIKKKCLDSQLRSSAMTLGKKEQWLVMSKQSKFLHAIPEIKAALDKTQSQGLLDQIFDKHLSKSAAACEHPAET